MSLRVFRALREFRGKWAAENAEDAESAEKRSPHLLK